jgi:hypothetical protein
MNAMVGQSSRGRFVALLALMWLALPLAWLRYRQVWDRLPARVATHFDGAGRANGWMTPQASLNFTLGTLLLLLVVFSAILFSGLRRAHKVDVSMWAVLGFFYVIIGFFLCISEFVLRYNLYGSSPAVGPILVGLLAAIVVFTVIYLRAHRGAELPASDVLAEETHGSGIFVLLFLLPAAVEAGAATMVPDGVKVALGLGAVILLLAAVFAGYGFHYRFTPAGVDIRTLGFRLRSIHAADIQSYAVAPWGFWGGYGIRGIGSERAYVWGNRGVRIKTLEGDAFLGHREPGKIVQDLDLIMHRHEAREGEFSS